MQRQKRKRYHKDNAPSDDIVTLINLVRQNPVLYNYKLQPKHRKRADVLNGWTEIAANIGNKYTVEECRRKWKNLRDTYHQYRLRKPKYIEGRLSKWRYAKELEFLSNVYQPKLKSQRIQSFDALVQDTLLDMKQNDDSLEEEEDEVDDDGQTENNDMQHLVNEDTETFILAAYEESVNDEVVTIIDPHQESRQHPDHEEQQEEQHEQHHHQHPSMPNIDSPEGVHVVDEDEDDDDIKEERRSSMEEEETTVTDVGYEAVTLSEEAENVTTVECEIGVDGSVGTSSPNSKTFHYIDANDFCMAAITATTTPTRSNPYVNSISSNSLLNGANGSKLKSLLVTSVPTSAISHSRQQSSAGAHLMGTATLTALSDVSNLGTSNMTTVSTAENVGMEVLEDGTDGTDSYVTPTIIQIPSLTSTDGSNNIRITTVGTSSPVSASTLSAICAQNGIIQLEDNSGTQAQSAKRDELDLFFDFLKKKIQCFSKSEITEIQVEFLNCVLQREAHKSSKE